jgi:hypothetical protein
MAFLLVIPVFLTLLFSCQKQLIVTETGDEMAQECPTRLPAATVQRGSSSLSAQITAII